MTNLEKGKEGLVMEGKATSKVKLRLSLRLEHNSALKALHMSSIPPQPVHAEDHIIINHLQHPPSNLLEDTDLLPPRLPQKSNG